jgi:long-chain acyl-CoA synthetase
MKKGYWQKPEANAAAFTADGYFRTGDIGMFGCACISKPDKKPGEAVHLYVVKAEGATLPRRT